MKVWVVIPSYNEEATIKDVVADVNNYIRNIIVVDDCSTDDTQNILKTLPTIIITNKKNLGYAKALELGLKRAFKEGGDYAISFDADGQHIGSDLQKVLDIIKQSHPDFVLGQRSQKNRLMEFFFGLYAQKKCGFSDPLCGIKAYKKQVFQEYGFLEKSYSIGTELIFRALSDKSKKRSYKEVVIKIKKRHDQTRFGNAIKGNWLVLLAQANIDRLVGI